MARATRLSPSVWNPVSSVCTLMEGEMASASTTATSLIPPA